MLIKLVTMLSYCLRIFSLFLVLFISLYCTHTDAYGSQYEGNITIKWDLINWTPDGYVAVVTISNFQKHRSIQAPGWRLGWSWGHKEVIWSILGSQVTNHGDCSHFKGYIPISCAKSPIIKDLNPKTPYNQQVENCCRGGVLAAWTGRPQARARSAFQVSVGHAANNNVTIKLPRNFTFKAPGGGYKCGPAKIVAPTKYITRDKRRVTQALMTWNVTCLHSN